ncbi:unnamed protein product [Cercopithifilaria johnstoni]|uniref:Major sperm protein n=1 Tax=Cercopithifilaria johnstoni TaxID=2874296 RepID=A0A8J2Q3C6_9BILA|nr:unnamed protein product [Cercopithifilaria johnstoni]
MGVFNTVEMLLSFVVLPLVVTLATLVSCGNSRPKHQINVARNSQRGLVKVRNHKSGSKKEITSSKTQKTHSTSGSRSSKSLTKSRKHRNIPLKPTKHTETLSVSGASAEVRLYKLIPLSHYYDVIFLYRRDLRMKPKELRWDTSGGFRQVLISNHTKTRRAIKVKCSDNNIYRVNPVYSFVDPGQILAIDILRQNGGAKVDKMVFVAAKANKEDVNPEALFKNKAPKPMMVIPLIAVRK